MIVHKLVKKYNARRDKEMKRKNRRNSNLDYYPAKAFFK